MPTLFVAHRLIAKAHDRAAEGLRIIIKTARCLLRRLFSCVRCVEWKLRFTGSQSDSAWNWSALYRTRACTADRPVCSAALMRNISVLEIQKKPTDKQFFAVPRPTLRLQLSAVESRSYTRKHTPTHVEKLCEWKVLLLELAAIGCMHGIWTRYLVRRVRSHLSTSFLEWINEGMTDLLRCNNLAAQSCDIREVSYIRGLIH